MKFCDKLPKLRKNNNMSQELLADRLGVSRQAISKWESGTSYPDMEKMIQMCTILNCTLEDLMDDGTIGKESNKSKYNFNDSFQQLLKSITKVYNMFISMNWKDRIKCIIEMCLIILCLFILGSISLGIANYISNNIFGQIPTVGYYITNILDNIYKIILVVLGITITVHLFKIRYLDYYILIEDKEAKEKTIEKPIEQNKDKIIIRDPKHSTVGIIQLLEKILIFIIKIFLAFMMIPVISLFVMLVIMLAMGIYHIIYGIIFFFITASIVGSLLLLYVVMEFVYRFIFNQKQSFKKLFIVIIGGLFLFGFGIGLSTVTYINYDYNENSKDLKYTTETKYIDINDNTIIEGYFDKDNVSYEIDNNIDNVKLDISYINDLNYKLRIDNNIENDNIYHISIDNDDSFIKSYKFLLKDLKKKEIRSYNKIPYIKIKLYLNQHNYEILSSNENNILYEK